MFNLNYNPLNLFGNEDIGKRRPEIPLIDNYVPIQNRYKNQIENILSDTKNINQTSKNYITDIGDIIAGNSTRYWNDTKKRKGRFSLLEEKLNELTENDEILNSTSNSQDAKDVLDKVLDVFENQNYIQKKYSDKYQTLIDKIKTVKSMYSKKSQNVSNKYVEKPKKKNRFLKKVGVSLLATGLLLQSGCASMLSGIKNLNPYSQGPAIEQQSNVNYQEESYNAIKDSIVEKQQTTVESQASNDSDLEVEPEVVTQSSQPKRIKSNIVFMYNSEKDLKSLQKKIGKYNISEDNLIQNDFEIVRKGKTTYWGLAKKLKEEFSYDGNVLEFAKLLEDYNHIPAKRLQPGQKIFYGGLVNEIIKNKKVYTAESINQDTINNLFEEEQSSNDEMNKELVEQSEKQSTQDKIKSLDKSDEKEYKSKIEEVLENVFGVPDIKTDTKIDVNSNSSSVSDENLEDIFGVPEKTSDENLEDIFGVNDATPKKNSPKLEKSPHRFSGNLETSVYSNQDNNLTTSLLGTYKYYPTDTKSSLIDSFKLGLKANFNSGDILNNNNSDISSKDASAEIALDSLVTNFQIADIDFSVGYQIVKWGNTALEDSPINPINPVDIRNPLKMEKIPNWIINIEKSFGDITKTESKLNDEGEVVSEEKTLVSQPYANLVIIPFQKGNKTDAFGTFGDLGDVNQVLKNAFTGYPTIAERIGKMNPSEENPDFDLSNIQYGIRARGTIFDDFDLSLNYFNGFSNKPFYKNFSINKLQMISGQPVPENVLSSVLFNQNEFKKEYVRSQMFGIGFETVVDWGGFVARGEFAYETSRPFLIESEKTYIESVEKPVLSGNLGISYNWENSMIETGIGVEYIEGYDNNILLFDQVEASLYGSHTLELRKFSDKLSNWKVETDFMLNLIEAGKANAEFIVIPKIVYSGFDSKKIELGFAYSQGEEGSQLNQMSEGNTIFANFNWFF